MVAGSKNLQSLGIKRPQAAGYLITEGGSNWREMSMPLRTRGWVLANSKEGSGQAKERKGKAVLADLALRGRKLSHRNEGVFQTS